MAGQNRRYSSAKHSSKNIRSANGTYQEGNTLRVVYPARPEYSYEQPARPAADEPVKKSREELLRRQERERAARQNARRAAAMSPVYVAFLAAATILFSLVCFEYVHLQNSITGYVSSISSLEEQIEELKSDNDAAESRINADSVITDVSDAAGDLGMSYPESSQVVTYSVEESDYMNQYSDVSER